MFEDILSALQNFRHNKMRTLKPREVFAALLTYTS